MKKYRIGLLFTIGWIALILGITGLFGDEPSLAFGLFFLAAGAALLALAFREELRRDTPRRASIVILLLGLFFLIMAVGDIGEDLFGVCLGFGAAAPLLAFFYLRLVRNRTLAADGVRQPRTVHTQPGTSASPRALRTCPHCGAPGQSEVCEYCGSPL